MTRADRDIRGPPRTSAPTNAARTVGPRIMWRAGPHTYHVTRRAVYMVGADVLGRPPPARTGATPVDDASARAAGDVGPYQHRTAVVCRTAHIMWRAGPYTYGRGGRPRPPAPRTHKDDAGGRYVRAGRRGRRPLPTSHSRGVQGRAAVTYGAVYMVGAMPEDDASARAAEDVGPYQRRTVVVYRATHISCDAQDDDAHDTLTDAGSLRPSDD